MMKTNRLAATLAVVLGTFALGAAQANEQGLRPLPEDVATQADETTQDTMPFPEGALQEAEPTPEVVQDAAPVTDAVASEDGDVSPEDDLATDTPEQADESMPESATALEPAAAAPTDAAVDTATAADTASTTDATASASSPATLEQAMETRFASGDENGNGVLTQAELDALDDDDLVFANIDGDADGSITRSEWSAQLSTQVASADADE
jgi:hypothetical protein